MTLLAPEADRAVRDAVEAFLGGSLRPSMFGEMVFETRNSRYRLMDGVLFASDDASMIGAELVGWLLEGPAQSVVQDGWIAGARGVMVDRKKSRNIIVTSTSRVLRVDNGSGLKPLPQAPAMPAGSYGNHQVGSSAPQAPQQPRPQQPVAAQPFVPAPVRPTPTPMRQIPPCPPAPIGRLPGTTELSVMTAMITREPSQPGAPMPMAPPSPRPNSAPQVTRASQPIHAPPRLTGRHPRVSIPSLSPPPKLKPLPFPTAPPSRSRVEGASTRHDTLREEVEEIDLVEEDATSPHDRADLPLPPPSLAPRPASRDAAPASGLRRSSNPTLPRMGSRRDSAIR